MLLFQLKTFYLSEVAGIMGEPSSDMGVGSAWPQDKETIPLTTA